MDKKFTDLFLDGSCDGAGDSSPVNRGRRVWSGWETPTVTNISSQDYNEKILKNSHCGLLWKDSKKLPL